MSRLIIVLLTAFTLSACAEYDGASEGAPAPEGPNIKSGVEGIRTAAENWWYDTDAYPYTPENLAHWARYQWRNQLNITKDTNPALTQAVARTGAKLHNWDEGWGFLVTDMHAVEVQLPKGDSRKTPRKLLEMMRDNPALLGGGPLVTDFNDEVTWPATVDRQARQAGDVVLLNLWGPDNAAIVYIDTDVSDQQFCVMTATHPRTGWHPVNGVRCWGYIEWDHNNYNYLFYTTGADSTTVAGSGLVGGTLQFEVWRAQMSAVARQVECIWGGYAGNIWQDDEVQEGIGKAPGRVGLSDVDHPQAWDAVRNASSQFEYDCKASERLPDEEAAPEVDADQDGVRNGDDLCRDTASGAKVWPEGEWAGCAAGQHRDK